MPARCYRFSLCLNSFSTVPIFHSLRCNTLMLIDKAMPRHSVVKRCGVADGDAVRCLGCGTAAGRSLFYDHLWECRRAQERMPDDLRAKYEQARKRKLSSPPVEPEPTNNGSYSRKIRREGG